MSHYRSLGDQSKPDEFQQASTKDGRKSAMKFVNRFHLSTGRPLSDNGDAFVTCSEFKDEKWLEAFSKWLSSAKKERKNLKIFCLLDPARNISSAKIS